MRSRRTVSALRFRSTRVPVGAVARRGVGPDPGIDTSAPSSALDDTHPSVRIASLLSASRARMDERIRRRYPPSSRFADPGAHVRTAPPEPGADHPVADVEFIAHHTFRCGRNRDPPDTPPQPVGTVSWYGQQEAHRVGYYDAIRRCGLVGFGGRENDLLDVQAALVGATGWWWAFERVCVMAERPSELHTEPNPRWRPRRTPPPPFRPRSPRISGRSKDFRPSRHHRSGVGGARP